MLASTAARWLPRDFVEVSQTGGVFTLAAYAIMLLVFVMELRSFATSSYSTLLLLDRYDSETLQINFDVDLYDIECRNVKLSVFSQSGEERIGAISQDFWLRPVDQRGHVYGMAITPKAVAAEEEEGGEADHKRQMDKLIKEDGKAELDADWSDSHDGFKHQSFEHVIQAHDFTFINFFAGWCSHCQKFSPIWAALAKRVNGDGGTPMEFTDRDGQQRKVRMIKMNCVDFRQVCQEKGIDAYPSLRLYKADGSFSVYEGKRDEADLLRWVERTVKMKSYGWASHHEAFERGCNAKGRLQIPRVPGHLELTAGGGDQNLNSRMTNVSHLVKHLSFSDPDDGKFHRKGWSNMPADVLKHVSPLDGKRFVTTEFHQAWIHDMKVVSTVSTNGKTAYQISHQKRLSKLKEQDIPQAQFHYDIEPFSIWVKRDEKKWYDFFTTLLAMLGGSFVMMRLASTFSLTAMTSLKSLMTPRRSKSEGELGY